MRVVPAHRRAVRHLEHSLDRSLRCVLLRAPRRTIARVLYGQAHAIDREHDSCSLLGHDNSAHALLFERLLMLHVELPDSLRLLPERRGRVGKQAYLRGNFLCFPLRNVLDQHGHRGARRREPVSNGAATSDHGIIGLGARGSVRAVNRAKNANGTRARVERDLASTAHAKRLSIRCFQRGSTIACDEDRAQHGALEGRCDVRCERLDRGKVQGLVAARVCDGESDQRKPLAQDIEKRLDVSRSYAVGSKRCNISRLNHDSEARFGRRVHPVFAGDSWPRNVHRG